MLQATDINVQSPTIQPTVIVDVSGAIKYTGTSISFSNVAGSDKQTSVTAFLEILYPLSGTIFTQLERK